MAGIQHVYTRAEAARRFRLMPSRIGELVGLGDRDTVFGSLGTELEALPPDYRSHGSLAESRVPLVVHNAEGTPQASYFGSDVDLARWLNASGVATSSGITETSSNGEQSLLRSE